MGIPNFYGQFIKKKHPNSVLNYIGNNNEGISFDMNGLIHYIAGITYAYGDRNNNPENVKKMARLSEVELEAEFFTKMTAKILEILTAINPKQYVMFCIDGVAPRAKINRQRSSRFVASTVGITTGIQPLFRFNSNCITPGTQFMENFNIKFQNWLATNKESFPPYLIYSSHLYPGEGEHKIMRHLRDNLGDKIQQGTGYHIIYGKDADLIMLAALNPVKNMLFCRENLRDSVIIDVLMDEVCETLNRSNNRDIGIRDFVLMDFFIGNDFLPHIPSLDNVSVIIDTMFEIYLRLDVTLTMKQGDNYIIDWNSFKLFTGSLAKEEPSLLARRGLIDYRYPFKMLIDNIVRKKEQTTTTNNLHYNVTNINYNNFRQDWYINALPGSNHLIDDIKIMSKKYVEMVDWILAYYQGYDVSQFNVYPYIFTPLLNDINISLQQDIYLQNDIFRKEDDIEILPIHQLLSVLPSKSSNLIPSPFNNLILPKGYLYDLCPIKFEIYRQGQDEEFKGVPILPPADLERVVEIYNTIMYNNPGVSLPAWMVKENEVVNYKGARSTVAPKRTFKPNTKFGGGNKPINVKVGSGNKPHNIQMGPGNKLTLKPIEYKPYHRKEKTVAKVVWVEKELM